MVLPRLHALFQNPTDLLKGGKNQQRAQWIIDPASCMTLEEVKAMFEAAKVRKTQGKTGVKDALFVVLALNTGLRISEIANLKIKNVVLTEAMYPHLFIERGKTPSSRRRVPINHRTAETLMEYYRCKLQWNEGLDDEEPLLRSAKGGHYTRFGLYDSWQRVLKFAKIKKPERFHPHSARHTFATHIYKLTNNLRLVQELLGHSSIRVTETYTSVFAEDRIYAVEELYGL